MPEIELRVGPDIPPDQLIELYKSVDWISYTREGPENLLKAIRNSTYVVTAWEGAKLVGLARGLSDDVSVLFLQDVLVRPAFQGRGIGKRLVEDCLERFAHVRSWVLLTDDDEGQLRFYQACGFQNTKDLRETRLNTFLRLRGRRLE